MKLKRYIMMNGNTIIDTNNTYRKCPEHWNSPQDSICYISTTGKNSLFGNLGLVLMVDVANVKNTSNNILDLVEVGDLVGYEITPNTMLEIAGVKEEVAMVSIVKTSRLNCFGTNNGDVKHDTILAIYKRQANGDYKRYEVEA